MTESVLRADILNLIYVECGHMKQKLTSLEGIDIINIRKKFKTLKMHFL